jgi:D-aminopeptidase
MLPHQLNRLAQHAGVGLAQVGGHNVGRNSSGDIFLAVSTANMPDEQLSGTSPNHAQPIIETNNLAAMKNECVDAVFRAASEATEEAILNSIVAGRDGRTSWEGMFLEGLPVEKVKALLEKYLIVV